ncbi:adenosylcobinamide-phosphate synthase CbiB [Pseudoruegeria sp. HB172150]|uniref:adenosylcobinamide-phosphate synthase CbiB n=1 Tax=Pseudoruegeria sp. HB172150 TaxID=2721164 RepID=UPI0015567F41
MSHAAILCGALLLDAALGEPRWLWSRVPHPAVLMGRGIGLADTRWNRGKDRREKGIAVIAAACIAAALVGWAIACLPGGWLLQLLIAAILLAQRSLCDHVSAVADALRLSTGEGRRAVAKIVGRDTAAMDDPAIARAALESAAENLSDGVIAPAFWFLVAGLPGLLVYKIVNTADSMIGYRTPRHAEFGWAAARLDDLLNWLPARGTALLIWLIHGRPGRWQDIVRDAGLHRSPNAGWPEAAIARALDTALAGPRSYDGTLRDFPFVHPAGNLTPGPNQIDAAVRILWRTWTGTLIIAVAIAVV